MTHAGSSSSLGQTIFTPSAMEAFHADDKKAAAAIVGLMVGIFTLGLFLYLGVCYWVTRV
jgi:hypothetical protein